VQCIDDDSGDVFYSERFEGREGRFSAFQMPVSAVKDGTETAGE